LLLLLLYQLPEIRTATSARLNMLASMWQVANLWRRFGPLVRHFGSSGRTSDRWGDEEHLADPPLQTQRCRGNGISSTSVANKSGKRWLKLLPGFTIRFTIAMECHKQDGCTSSDITGIEHLGSTSDRVMLRKHLHLRRQRAANACTGCHMRKVRCDVSRFGLPCTNCRINLKICTVKESRRGAKKEELNR
jgi:hypothetical protein